MLWDPDKVFSTWQSNVNRAEGYLNQIRQRAQTDSSYQHIYDERLAELYFFNSLPYSPSQGVIIKHLRVILSNQPPFCPDAFEMDRFWQYFTRKAETLLNELNQTQHSDPEPDQCKSNESNENHT